MKDGTRVKEPNSKILNHEDDTGLMVRYLRRRLWQAIENHDASVCHALWRTTRPDIPANSILLRQKTKKDRKEKSIRIDAINEPLTAHTGDVALLPAHMSPSEPFSADDYLPPEEPYAPLELQWINKTNNSSTILPVCPQDQLQQQQPRATKRFFAWNKPRNHHDSIVIPHTDPRMTTPLHEACRLGQIQYVKYLLTLPGADPNLRNGAGQSCLHVLCCGLPVPPPMLPINSTKQQRTSFLQKVWKRSNHKHEKETVAATPPPPEISEDERLATAQLLLQWTHPEDDSNMTGQGISINAVDKRGRTALHYAAEAGRQQIALLLANTFGTMLTIVDDQAQTPCELTDTVHKELAAQLEARALLYLDPYGMDDELMRSVDTSAMSTTPFLWYETVTLKQAADMRIFRIEEATQSIKDILELHAAGVNTMRMSDRNQNSKKGKEDNDDALARQLMNAVDFKNEEELAPLMNLHASHVEAFLIHHKWNVRASMIKFVESPIEAFQHAGVELPKPYVSRPTNDIDDSKTVGMCLICCDTYDITSDDWCPLKGCEHAFCKECLGEYLADCAASKSTGFLVPCPHHECSVLLDPKDMDGILTDDYMQSLLQNTSTENFIVTESTLRFCPHPGCTGVVRFKLPPYVMKNGLPLDILDNVGASCNAIHESQPTEPLNYEAVPDQGYYDAWSTQEPRRAHRFCFACGELGVHWPCPCNRLNEWKAAIQDVIKDVKDGTTEDHNEIAMQLWMKTNTRPCPKCSAPIEKNEGCNHMTCSNPSCKHEFCWICRNDWKLHSTETGGYFRCNRWVGQEEHQFYDDPPPEGMTDRVLNLTNEDLSDPRTMEVTYGTAMHAAKIARRKEREMDRFIHHYQRWNAHDESAKLELKMSSDASARLRRVVSAAAEFTCDPEFNFHGIGLSFVHSAFVELRECRSLLKHSYAYAYFRYDLRDVRKRRRYQRHKKEQNAFETIQSELEVMTEQISDVIARSRLRATKPQIIYLTVSAANKRKEFSNLMINILVAERKETAKDSNEEVKPQQRRTHSKFSRFLDAMRDFEYNSSRYRVLLSQNGFPSVVDDDFDDDYEDDEFENYAYNPLVELMAEPRDTGNVNDDLDYLPPYSGRSGSRSVRQAMLAAIEEQQNMSSARYAPWSCSACTFINSTVDEECAMCATRRAY